MAAYDAFRCDFCGQGPVDAGDRTKVTTRYEGPSVEGVIVQEACLDCAVPPDDAVLKPIRRRGAQNVVAVAEAHD